MGRRCLWYQTLALTAALIVGCSSAGETPLNEELEEFLGISWHEIPEFQQDILEDGQVTRDELERATFAVIQCLRESGIFVTEPVYDASLRQYVYEFGGTATQEELEPLEEVYDQCSLEYDSLVISVWIHQTEPSEAEKQEIRDRIGACMRARGADVPEHPSDADIMGVLLPSPDEVDDVFVDCMQSY